MHEQRMRDGKDALEERVMRALERVPEVKIPAEFAARVAGRLPCAERLLRGLRAMG